MEFKNNVVSYQMELTPLFSKQGEIVLLYLKDSIDEFLDWYKEGDFTVFPKISIEYYQFLKENQVIHRIRDVYHKMIEDNVDSILKEQGSMTRYVDSFMNLEYIADDITEEGILHINRNEFSFVWLITQSEWINQLANNQYKIMVNLTFKEEK